MTTRMDATRDTPLKFRYLTLGAMLAAYSLTLGCQSFSKPGGFDLPKSLPWKSEKPQIPNRVVGYWTEATLNTAGEQPKRGLGGRLLFQ